MQSPASAAVGRGALSPRATGSRPERASSTFVDDIGLVVASADLVCDLCIYSARSMTSLRGYPGRRVGGLGVMLALALGALLGLTHPATASAASSPRICFYTEDRDIIHGSKSGHAFLQLLPTA